jgi:hypothetical protein
MVASAGAGDLNRLRIRIDLQYDLLQISVNLHIDI